MTRIWTIAFIIMLTAATGVLAPVSGKTQQPVVIFGDDNYPPYSYLEDGKAKGIYVDLLTTAFSRMPEYNITIRLVPWKRGLNLLETGQGFALFPPYKLPKARPYIYPYSAPLFEESVIVVCRKELTLNKPTAHWPADYQGLRFGMNLGFHMGLDSFWAEVEAKRIAVEHAPGTTGNIIKLTQQRIDCYLNDRLAILFEYNRAVEKNKILGARKAHPPFSVGPTIASNYAYLGYARNSARFPYKNAFMFRFDQTIQEMHARGEVDEIVLRHLQ
ncbi:transporter substrate-binding domain-containing protein [Desulfovibrio mangrovi]|uniref:substrate-binding periplasmic protein n=1 Tax=Desulfovibrio mangrovi TaxID=2976983 RepID=UPI002245E5F0|nr:transporter substrate-binding domain-containing protein [Desulfovibrio mangrovi]UZP67059.1 transporter substrate-binding domain-containing protein [Desulfovibrio mangrovi]